MRKLLLHRYEINKIEENFRKKGLTLVPLKVYFKGSLVKVEIGVARGRNYMTSDRILPKKIQRREAERSLRLKNL